MNNKKLDISKGYLDADESFRKVCEATPVAMIVSFPDGGFEYVNPALIKLLGYSKDEIYRQDITVTHPQDLAANDELRKKLRKNPFTPVCMEKRYIHKKGHTIHGLLTIVAQANKDRSVKRFIAQVVDVSVQKKALEEARLGSIVYTNCSEAMAVINIDNTIISVNPAFTQITGYSEDECLGKNMNMLSSGLQSETFYNKLWDSLLTTGSWQGEIYNKKKNGDIYTEHLTINTEYDTRGKVVRRVALFSDISEKKKAETLILKQANYDALTDLPNRRLFIEYLQKAVLLANKDQGFGALLFIDLDRFKIINDSLGHNQGDNLLIEVARRLSASVRGSDIVARFSGDEFTVILTPLFQRVEIEFIVQKILKAMSQPFQLEKNKAYISASVGISLFPSDANDADDLISNADQAMYVAKSKGRNCFHYFTQCMQMKAQKRLQLISDLHIALDKEQFFLDYQPIVQMNDLKIVKAEALIRWKHPTQGIVMPNDFIEAAENSGIINKIGDWVFKQACEQLRDWHDKGFHFLQLSINISPLQFNTEGITPSVWQKERMQEGDTNLPIVMEITENFLLEKSSDIRQKVAQLQSMGFKLAIDDFGTGYSSISYLKELNGNYLKIDRSFVTNICDIAEDLALCEAIIFMAHKLGVKVIAEGIETQEQYRLLKEIGCDYGQGWLFSKAIAPDSLIKLLAKQ